MQGYRDIRLSVGLVGTKRFIPEVFVFLEAKSSIY